MQIEKILPVITGGSLAETLHQLIGTKTQGLLFEKHHFARAVSAGWIKPGFWPGRIYLEQAWSDTNQLPSSTLNHFEVEEVLVAHGFEPDLSVWRDLALNSQTPLHLVIQPTAMVNPETLAEVLTGQPMDRVYFDFGLYTGNQEIFTQSLEALLPGLKLQKFPCPLQALPQELSKDSQPFV